jgi:bifunctional non-homologous end joining protein LigD
MPPRPKLSPPTDLPDFIPPQLGALADKAPAGDGWIHEVRFDGYRLQAGAAASGKAELIIDESLLN